MKAEGERVVAREVDDIVRFDQQTAKIFTSIFGKYFEIFIIEDSFLIYKRSPYGRVRNIRQRTEIKIFSGVRKLFEKFLGIVIQGFLGCGCDINRNFDYMAVIFVRDCLVVESIFDAAVEIGCKREKAEVLCGCDVVGSGIHSYVGELE